MLRWFARAASPLLFALAFLILGTSFAVAGEPVKPEAKAADSKPQPSKPVATKPAATGDIPQTSRAAGETSEATIGEPLAPGMIEILQQEIRSAAHTRGIDDNIARFHATPDSSSIRRPRPIPVPSWRATAASPGTITCCGTP